MDAYVARQPIFDRHMKIYGYELLYRQGTNNFYEGTDDSQATASLLADSFLVIGFNELTGGARGFINFSQEFLQKGVPRLLPKKKVVIEVLERVEATGEVVEACRRLKEEGYMLALDDFILEKGGGGSAPLVGLADIIKIEFPNYPEKLQMEMIRRFRGKVTFLAEKVETAGEYQRALRMGYSLFQGYFFSRPVMVNAKDIGALDANLLRILKEIHRKEPNMPNVAGIIEQDIGLSYKLLRMANSVYYGAREKTNSILQAVMRVGIGEMEQWIDLMLLKGVENNENAELIKTSMIRGKILSLMAEALGKKAEAPDYFIVGTFSSLDELLHREMREIIPGLSLNRQTAAALLGAKNEMSVCLQTVLRLERADWAGVTRLLGELNIGQGAFMDIYIRSLRWQAAHAADLAAPIGEERG